MHKLRSRGFTLIELLVVIAIIGILSAVVLASLNTARTKGQTAAVQSDLDSIRTQAELYYGDHGNAYAPSAVSNTTCSVSASSGAGLPGMFSDKTIISALKSADTDGGGDGVCYTDSNGYGYAIAFPTRAYSGVAASAWCIDSTGVSRGTTAAGVAYASAAAAVNSGAAPSPVCY